MEASFTLIRAGELPVAFRSTMPRGEELLDVELIARFLSSVLKALFWQHCALPATDRHSHPRLICLQPPIQFGHGLRREPASEKARQFWQGLPGSSAKGDIRQKKSQPRAPADAAFTSLPSFAGMETDAAIGRRQNKATSQRAMAELPESRSRRRIHGGRRPIAPIPLPSSRSEVWGRCRRLEAKIRDFCAKSPPNAPHIETERVQAGLRRRGGFAAARGAADVNCGAAGRRRWLRSCWRKFPLRGALETSSGRLSDSLVTLDKQFTYGISPSCVPSARDHFAPKCLARSSAPLCPRATGPGESLRVSLSVGGRRRRGPKSRLSYPSSAGRQRARPRGACKGSRRPEQVAQTENPHFNTSSSLQESVMDASCFEMTLPWTSTRDSRSEIARFRNPCRPSRRQTSSHRPE